MKTQKLTLNQLMQDAELIKKENLNSIKGGQQEVTYDGGTLQEVTIVGTKPSFDTNFFNFPRTTFNWETYYHPEGSEFILEFKSGGGGYANPHAGYSWYDCPVENPCSSPLGDVVKDAIQKNQTDAQNSEDYAGQLLFKIINHSLNN